MLLRPVPPLVRPGLAPGAKGNPQAVTNDRPDFKPDAQA